MNFRAVHADGGWRIDSEANFVSPDRHHRDGYLIVDHKSGAVTDHSMRFATYWPQLAAYVDAVACGKRRDGDDVAALDVTRLEWK